jgi:uncharacterized protein
MNYETDEQVQRVAAILQELGSVLVAFSGGVDSSLLLAIALDTLGAANCLAVCARSPLFTEAELARAQAFCTSREIPLMVIEHDVLNIAGIAANSPNRCYICKKSMLETLLTIASERGLAHVVEGSNTDDLGDYRPGRQAVIELGVRSPLLEANLDKTSIRAIARAMALECADLPAQACLATRFAFGHELTMDGLKLVERSEQYLHELGFGLVRVRVSVSGAGATDAGTVDGSGGDASDAGSTDDASRYGVNDVADVAGLDRLPLAARIECDEDGMRKLQDSKLADEIKSTLQAYGFTEVSIDPSGYRMGSMNN